MELIQIIAFTLKLFTASSLVIISISYTVYKIKNRSKLKPHLRPSKFTATKYAIKFAEPETKEVFEEEIEFVPNVKPQLKRFKVLNDSEQNRVFEERPANKRKIKIEKPVVINELATAGNQKIKMTTASGDFNIFKFYSQSEFEPMHKLKM